MAPGRAAPAQRSTAGRMILPTRQALLSLAGMAGLGASPATGSVQALITATATSYGIPPAIALAVANQESGYNQAAVGSKGEIGVFQLMPATATGLGVNPLDLGQNVQGGVSLLSTLYNQYGNWNDALIAYNEGPTALNAGTVYSSSQSYANSILAASGASDVTAVSSPSDTSGDGSGASVDTSGGIFGLSTAQLAFGAIGALFVLWSLK